MKDDLYFYLNVDSNVHMKVLINVHMNIYIEVFSMSLTISSNKESGKKIQYESHPREYRR